MMKSSNNKIKIITFVGIDGSGKTTLAKNSVKIMEKKGINSKYVYGRLEPFLLKPFIAIGRVMFLKKNDMFEDYNEYSTTKRQAINRNPLMFKVYRSVMWIDYFLQLLIKIRIPLLTGKTLACDRYVYDTIITDLSADLGHSQKEIKEEVEKWFSITPRPDIVFLIDLPEQIAFDRKDDTPSIDYLKERRSNYLELAKAEGMEILDGTQQLEELEAMISNKLDQERK